MTRGFAKHVGVAGLAALLSSPAEAAVTVFLDFNSAWITELSELASDAGVATFNSTERATIESNIQSQIQSAFAGYQISLTLTDPGGTRDRIDFGVNENVAPAGTLGFAPLHIANAAPSNADISILTRNFDFSIDEGPSRPQQISQVSRAISSTAVHELAHSFGLMHQHSYGNPGITPANYNNTGGLQNQHFMATGDTGLNEAQRETARSFNRWERAMLDITGGSVFGGRSVVIAPVTSLVESGDLGGTTATAAALTFTTGETSGMDLSFVRGDLDGSETDIDVVKFVVASAGLLTAELYSINLFAESFNGRLRLFGTDGTTVLASNDDVAFSGNSFGVGSIAEQDPFLLNIQLPSAGTYFLEVSAVSGGAAGDDYQLLTGFAAIPEPGTVAMLGLAGSAGLIRRRRRATR